MKKLVFKIVFIVFIILLFESSLSQMVQLRFHCTLKGAHKVSKTADDKMACDVFENSEVEILLTASVIPANNQVCITAIQLPKDLNIRFLPSCMFERVSSKCTVKIPDNTSGRQYKLVFRIYTRAGLSKDLTITLNVKSQSGPVISIPQLPDFTQSKPIEIPPETIPLPVIPMKPQYASPPSTKTDEESSQTPMYGPYTSRTDKNGNFSLEIPILKKTVLKGVILNQDHQPVKNSNIKVILIPKLKEIKKLQDIGKIIIFLDNSAKAEISDFKILSSIDLFGRVERTIILGEVILREVSFKTPVDL